MMGVTDDQDLPTLLVNLQLESSRFMAVFILLLFLCCVLQTVDFLFINIRSMALSISLRSMRLNIQLKTFTSLRRRLPQSYFAQSSFFYNCECYISMLCFRCVVVLLLYLMRFPQFQFVTRILFLFPINLRVSNSGILLLPLFIRATDESCFRRITRLLYQFVSLIFLYEFVQLIT